MKFVELKSNLKNRIENLYLLEGNDRFVIYSALELIEKAVGLTMPELNKQVFNNGNVSMADVLLGARVVPFADEKRLVVVWDCNASKDFSLLEEFIKEKNSFSVLVFVNPEQNDFSKQLKKVAVTVDCSKLDLETLKKWVANSVGKSGKKIEESVAEKLIAYCNSSLSRLSSELQKLVASTDEEFIKSIDVESFVVPDKEFQIYELTNAIANKDRSKVFDIVNKMLELDKNVFKLTQYLYSSFRKLLYICLSDKSDDELSKYFNVKPYAIKMNRVQIRSFSPKLLKQINKDLSDLEYKIKSGQFNSDVAVDYIICKILLQMK